MRYKGKNKSIFINDVVLCEAIWVLKHSALYSRQDIYNVVSAILSTEEFAFSAQDLLIEAVTLYKNGKADFSDYLIYLQNRGARCTKTFSFDKKACVDGIFVEIKA